MWAIECRWCVRKISDVDHMEVGNDYPIKELKFVRVCWTLRWIHQRVITLAKESVWGYENLNGALSRYKMSNLKLTINTNGHASERVEAFGIVFSNGYDGSNESSVLGTHASSLGTTGMRACWTFPWFHQYVMALARESVSRYKKKNYEVNKRKEKP